MNPFREDDGDQGWWDYYEIGGRVWRTMPYDVGTLADCLTDLADQPIWRLIVAGPRLNDENRLDVASMWVAEQWNGTTYEPTGWDRTIKHALRLHKARLVDLDETHREARTPRDDWLGVTVDYHS